MTSTALQRLAEARPASLDPSGSDADAEIARILAQPRAAAPQAGTARREPVRLRRRLVFGAGALAAAVAAVTVLTGGPAERSTPPPTAQQVLLTAAEHTVAQRAATSGRYWHRVVESGQLDHFSMGGEEFDVVAGSHFEYYDAQDGSRSYDVHWSIGGKPATDRDAEAIARAGDPGFFPYDPDGTPEWWGVSTADGKRVVTDRASTPYPFGGMTLTFAQLAALPTDPVRLKTVIAEAAAKQGNEFVPAGFWLAEMPIRAEVRAAVYRLLSERPEARSLGTVTDWHGRRVNAIAWDEKYWFPRVNHPIPGFSRAGTGNGWIEARALIDPATGSPLGYEWYVKTLPRDAEKWLRAGQLVSYSLNLESGWTDEGPAK